MGYDRRKYDGLTLEQKVDEALELLDGISYAFPDGPTKHRETHEAWIKAKRAETEFYQELKLDLLKKGLWFMILLVSGLIVAGIVAKLGITAK